MEIFDYLLYHPNININNRNYFGETSLLKSMQCSSEVFALKLIEAGADVSVSNLSSETPLHHAVKYNFKKAAHLMIEKGADVNALDFNFYSPLHEAVCYSDFEMVAMLLFYGADADCLNLHDLTPFMMAVHRGVDPEIQTLLLEYEVDFNRIADDDYSTLLLALNSHSCVSYDIVERGADVNYFVGEVNALKLSIHLDDPSAFKAIWSKFNYNLVYSNTMSPLLYAIHETCAPNNTWLEYISTIFYSDLGPEIIQHIVNNGPENYFTRLVSTFSLRKLPEKVLFPFVCISFTVGAEAFLTNATQLYAEYGYSETFKLFLHMGVEINYSHPPTLANYIINPKIEPVLDFYVPKSTYFSRDLARNINNLLNFFTPSLAFREQIEACSDRNISPFSSFQYRFATPCPEYMKICYRLRDFPSVASLTELSRNVARKFIITKFKVTNCSHFYCFLRYSNIPNIIKRILAYEVPVNWKT